MISQEKKDAAHEVLATSITDLNDGWTTPDEVLDRMLTILGLEDVGVGVNRGFPGPFLSAFIRAEEAAKKTGGSVISHFGDEVENMGKTPREQPRD